MQQPPNYPNYGGWQQQQNTQYPPPQPWQQPQYPPPPETYYPPQQPPFQQQPWQSPMMPMQKPPNKKRRLWLIIGIIAAVLVVSFLGYERTLSVPTLSPEQFKASAQNTTVENLDKDSNADKNQNVHFTCKIFRFVKDDSGNTAGANVESSDTSSFTFVQVIFPTGTDIAQLNTGDSLEVWGTDQGVFSGNNAFGTQVQEVVVGALYMTDTTTGYQTP